MNQFIQNLFNKGQSIAIKKQEEESEEIKSNIFSWQYFKEQVIKQLEWDEFSEYVYSEYDLQPEAYKWNDINYHHPSKLYILLPESAPIRVKLVEGCFASEGITLYTLKDKKSYIWIYEVDVLTLNGFRDGFLYHWYYWAPNDKSLLSASTYDGKNRTKKDVRRSNKGCFDEAFYRAKEAGKDKKEQKFMMELIRKSHREEN